MLEISTIVLFVSISGTFVLFMLCMVLFDLFDIPFYFGGTALLIVVGVGLDLVNQIEAFLLNQNYDGFMKKTKRRQMSAALRL